MKNEIVLAEVQDKIFILRNQQVMLDSDLAKLYGVETKRLNEAVKRNIDRFPEDFFFQLTPDDIQSLRSQIATSNWASRSQIVTLNDGELAGTPENTQNLKSQNATSRSQFATLKNSRGSNLKYMPYAFTENGIAMLSSVLRSKTAISVNIQIMRAFVAMRKFIAQNAQIFSRLNNLEIHQLETDKCLDALFTQMESYGNAPAQGIFFQGQIFDAYSFFEKLIQKAKKSIILIDNYVDITVLQRLAKKKKSVPAIIYTSPKTKLTALDVEKFNAQYPTLELRHTSTMHDRFLILDNDELYYVGASLKDLGTKCFAFEKMNDAQILVPEILKNL